MAIFVQAINIKRNKTIMIRVRKNVWPLASLTAAMTSQHELLIIGLHSASFNSEMFF